MLGADLVDVRVFAADLAGVRVDLGDRVGDTGMHAPHVEGMYPTAQVPENAGTQDAYPAGQGVPTGVGVISKVPAGETDDVSVIDGALDDVAVRAGLPDMDDDAVSEIECVLAVVAAGGVPTGLEPVLRVADALPLLEDDNVDDPLDDPLDVAEDDPLAVLEDDPLAVLEDDPLVVLEDDPLDDPLVEPLDDADDVEVNAPTEDSWAANVVLAVVVGT